MLPNMMADTIIKLLPMITTSATHPSPDTTTVPATAGATTKRTAFSPLRSPRQLTHHSDSRTLYFLG